MANHPINQVEHVVVLMLENRSFDHLFGFLHPRGPSFEGLTGDEWVPVEPADLADDDLPEARRARVTRGVSDGDTPNPVPGELFCDINVQLFGRRVVAPGARPTMRGFAVNYGSAIDHHNDAHPLSLRDTEARAVMECHAPEQLPVLATLAREFAVSDAWHASAPTQTFANRYFLHAATSDGRTDNFPILPFFRETLFDRLARRGLGFRIYFHDVPSTALLGKLWDRPQHFHRIGELAEDAASGDLPAYAFVEPRYFQSPAGEPNDMHPPAHRASAERLVADVYNALRAGPKWNQTLFVVLFDEHGGTYDHVAPPAATPPDDRVGASGFGFDRFGVRVPALFVSPLIERGTVMRPPAGGPPFDHTSLLSTLFQRFDLGPPLTARDAAAPSFADVVTRTSPRDTPARLDAPPSPTLKEELEKALQPSGVAQALTEALRHLPNAATLAAGGEPESGHTGLLAVAESRLRAFLSHLF